MRWLRNLGLGDPGGIPWLSIGVLVGVGCGALGYLWARRQSRVAALAVTFALIVEPLVYLTRAETLHFPSSGYRLSPRNLSIWAVEFVIGVGATTWVVLRGRRGGAW